MSPVYIYTLDQASTDYCKVFDNFKANHFLQVSLGQWFSTVSLKEAKSRLATLFESRTKEILTHVS